MSRQQRIYRLVIVYPEGSHEPGWRPARWSDPRFLKSLGAKGRRELRSRKFRWPRERQFLSSSGAYGRAALLRWYGAEVEVLSSDPVTWPNYEAAFSEGDWEHPWGSAMRWHPDLETAADAMDEQATRSFKIATELAQGSGQ